MLKDFKAFIMKGNVVDMAVGIIIGVAFGSIIKSLVGDVLMPPIGLLLGDVDFSNLFVVLKEGEKAAAPYATLAEAQGAGAVVMAWGVLVNHIINFIIVAFAVFMLVRSLNNMKRKEEAAPAEPTTKDCQHCYTSIPIKAARCPHCTSQLAAA